MTETVITPEKLDELEKLAKGVIALRYNSADPGLIDEYYDSVTADTTFALIARVRELEADRKAWQESTTLAQQQTDIWMNRAHELEQKCKEQS